MLSSKNITIVFGSTFILVGLLGFIPNPLVSANGIFEVNAMHNLVHLLTGAAFSVRWVSFGGERRNYSEDRHCRVLWCGIAWFPDEREYAFGYGPHQRG